MKSKWLLLAIGCLLPPLLAGAESYQATAVVKLENADGGEEAKRFMNQALDKTALEEVAARLVLKTAWKLEPAQVVAKLASVLEVKVDGRGDGRVSARDESPVMAAVLANAAASVLKDRRGQGGRGRSGALERSGDPAGSGGRGISAEAFEDDPRA